MLPCQNDPDGWFPPDKNGRDEVYWYKSKEAQVARDWCSVCPYTDCLKDNGTLPHGIVAGLSPEERRVLRVSRIG